MKTEQLKNAIDKIDDKYISEAEFFDPETMKFPRSPVVYIAPAAAVAASVALIAASNIFSGIKNVPVGPEINNNYTQVSDTAVTTVTESVKETSGSAGKISEHVSDVLITKESSRETGKPESSVPAASGAVSENIPQHTEPYVTTCAPVTKPQETEPSEIIQGKETESPVSKPNVNAEVTTETGSDDPISPADVQAPPITFYNFKDLKSTVSSYDLNYYSDIYRSSYAEMFERIRSDGYILVPDFSENSISPDEIWDIWAMPHADYEDIGIICSALYDSLCFQVEFHYTDRAVFDQVSDQTEYFRKRLGIDLSGTDTTDNGVTVGNINGKECAYSFIDDDHYYIVRTNASHDEMIKFLNEFSPEKISLE